MEWFPVGISVIAIIFYIVFFTWVSTNWPDTTGKNDILQNWNKIKQDPLRSWVCPVLAILCSFIVFFLLIGPYPDHSVFLMMGLACLGVGLGVVALSFALLSR